MEFTTAVQIFRNMNLRSHSKMNHYFLFLLFSVTIDDIFKANKGNIFRIENKLVIFCCVSVLLHRESPLLLYMDKNIHSK